MIRATLDVNVLVSGFPESSGAPGELIAWWLGRRFSLILSEHILSTLVDVWGRPYWRAHFEQDKVQRAIDLLRARAIFVAPDLTIKGVAVDDEDDLVLGTAVAGKADYLVTGDKPLRALYYNGALLESPANLGKLTSPPHRIDEILECETPPHGPFWPRCRCSTWVDIKTWSSYRPASSSTFLYSKPPVYSEPRSVLSISGRDR